jgi:uncharacterized membrane protein
MFIQKDGSEPKKHKKHKHSWIYFLFGVVAFIASIWSLLWVFSSASLASGFCNSHFTFWHEHFRCRQPYFALCTCIAFGVISLILFIVGLRRFKRD